MLSLYPLLQKRLIFFTQINIFICHLLLLLLLNGRQKSTSHFIFVLHTSSPSIMSVSLITSSTCLPCLFHKCLRNSPMLWHFLPAFFFFFKFLFTPPFERDLQQVEFARGYCRKLVFLPPGYFDSYCRVVFMTHIIYSKFNLY